MKPLVIIISITIIIIAVGCIIVNILGSESERLSKSLSELEQDIENQSWKEASGKVVEFHRKWNRVSIIWSMIIDHYEIDSIELALAQLASYVSTENRDEALSQISSLKILIKHIPEKEAFNLRNVF